MVLIGRPFVPGSATIDPAALFNKEIRTDVG